MKFRSIRWMAWVVFLILVGALLLMLYKQGAFFETTKETEEKKGEELGTSNEPIVPADIKVKEDLTAYGEALKKGSEEACSQIKFDETLKQKCLDGIRYTAIINRKNPEECELLFDPTTRQFCINKIYFLKAVDNLDAGLCEKIVDAGLKTECLDQINVMINANQQTLENCETIKNESLKSTCLDQYYYRIGVDKKEASDCSKIDNRILQERCIKVIAKTPSLATGTKSTTQYLTGEERIKSCQALEGEGQSECKNDANYQLAFSKKDLAYCSLITDAGLKIKCQNDQTANINRYYLQLAVAKKDAALCQKIIREDAKTACLNYLR